jgi:hypothetical protein
MSKKTQIVIFAVLLVILAAAIYYAVFHQPASLPTSQTTAGNYVPIGAESSELHRWRIEEARKTEYAKTVHNIFTIYTPPPPPTPGSSSGPGTVQQPAVPPTPPPPQLPVKFFGYSSIPGSGERRAFFTNGDDVYIVGEGETLLGQFRILRIGNNTLDFEEISSGRRNSVALEFEAPSA